MKDYNEKANQLSDLFNCFGGEKELAEAFSHQHPTLQANFMRFCREYLAVCARDDYRYDARNESVHKIAKDVNEIMFKEAIPYV